MNVRWTLLILVLVYVALNQWGFLVPDCPQRPESRAFLAALVRTDYVPRGPIGTETAAERAFLTQLFQRTFDLGDRPLEPHHGVVLREALAALPGLQRGWSKDFYHLWAIPIARRLAPQLSDPYVDPDAYVAVLRRHAPRETDPRFAAPHAFRQERFDPTGTPLAYVAFSFLPSGYVAAARTFALLQIAAFLGAMLLLGRVAGLDATTSVLLAAIALWLWSPLQTDRNAGNVNTFQLLLLVLVLAAHRGARRALDAGAAGWRAVLLVALPPFLVGALCAFKPNVSWTLPAYLVTWWLAFPARWRLRAGAVALAGVLVLAALPAIAFGSFGVWGHWLDSVEVLSGDELSSDDDHQTSERLEARLGVPEPVARHGLLALLLVSLVVGSSRVFRGASGTSGSWRAVWREPELSLSAAVLLSLATAPFVWQHHYVLALLPVVVVLARARAAGPAAWLALLAAVLMSRTLYGIARELGMGLELAFDLFELPFSWLPLWIALWLVARPRTVAPGSLEMTPAVR